MYFLLQHILDTLTDFFKMEELDE